MRLREDGKKRIDARLYGALAQELGTKAVDRVDVRFLELLERQIEPAANGRIGRVRAFLFECFTQAQLQLAGGLLGEGDGHDLLHRRAPGCEDLQDPFDQLRRLAGAGRGLDDEGIVEIVDDRVARVFVLCDLCQLLCPSLG